MKQLIWIERPHHYGGFYSPTVYPILGKLLKEGHQLHPLHDQFLSVINPIQTNLQIPHTTRPLRSEKLRQSFGARHVTRRHETHVPDLSTKP